MSNTDKPKSFNPYIISKRTPTQFNTQVSSIVHEQTDCVYVASGNLVNIYSLTTNLLIGTFRSKRQQQSQDKTKGDVHRGNIVAMSLVKDKLIALCSKGVLSEWDVSLNQLIDVFELQSLGKIKIAFINDENIAIYDERQQVFKFFDTNTKSLKLTLSENKESQGYVNAFALQNTTFAYIKGRNLIIHDLLEKNGGKPRLIHRDTLLRTVAINQNSSLIALSDDFGKIYIVHIGGKHTAVQTLHWHAHRVSALTFIPNTPFLLSGGEEAVIVQWHLETQSKQFISRLGAPIKSISLSAPNQLYYSVNMQDNSVKVIHFDNNKTKVHVTSLQLDRSTLSADEPVFTSGNLLIPHHSSLQLYDVDDKTLHSLQVKPHNFVSKMNKTDIPPQNYVKSFCMTPNKKHLITYEELLDQNSHKDIRLQAVKFWSREIVEEGFQGFEVKWVVQDPCSKEGDGIKLHAVNNKQLVIACGSQVQIWANQNGWKAQTEISYQSLNVLQIVSNIRYRIGKETKNIVRCIVLLHENGVLSFWNQDTLNFVYSFRLNSPSKKVIFEQSNRYLASLSTSGSVEVWKIKGFEEKHWWDLSFNSVADIIENPCKENQFILTMNSGDKQLDVTDSILLFQYSRPQNLIMYWKSQLPFVKALFCQQAVETSSYLLLINKNLELQKIYFGVTRDTLKNIAQKRRMSMDLKIRETENAKEQDKKADYQFIDKKALEDRSHINSLLNLQEAQVKRLDKVDKILGDGETYGAGSFLGMASLHFYFEQFAQEMLTKASTANNLIDLQVELQQNHKNKNEDIEMQQESRQENEDIYAQISEEVAKAFEQMFK